MNIALVREIGADFDKCQLTHVARQPIDLDLARQQHAAYQLALQQLGCRLVVLPAQKGLPDAVFVEDLAVVLDEVCVITRPGAPSRRGEVASLVRVMADYRQVLFIQPPGCLDGGDVLRLGKTLYVGQSQRSNRSGIQQLETLLAPYGYAVIGVGVRGCLHLKTAITQVGPDLLLLNPEWVDGQVFGSVAKLSVHPSEAMGANGLLVRDTLMYASAFPRTAQMLELAGCSLRLLDVSELAKAEGALTCCSLIFGVA